MAMKAALVSPPFVKDYMRNARCDFVSLSGTQWYPILLGQCGAWLEKRGVEVLFIDAPAQGLSFEETEVRVKAFEPDWIVFYSGRLSEGSDAAFSNRLCAATGARGVFVGPYASINPEATLSKLDAVKFVVDGEFEHPVAELLEGRDPAQIGNLLWRGEDGTIRRNPRRPPLQRAELDAIPFVSAFFKKHLDVKTYRALSEPYPYMDILTGRGCKWGLCSYCLWVHTFARGPVYNTRSIENVIEEMRFIEKELPQVRSLMIQDDTFTQDRITEFCHARLKAGLKLPWSCYCRADLSAETLQLMKRAGALNLHVGFESADDGILKNVRKGLTRERMTRFAVDARSAGLRLHGDFALGFPGETRETAQATIDWALQIRPHTAQFQLMIPFPGTPFHDYLAQRGWLDKNGYPSYPDLSSAELESISKRAYRRFYLHPAYFAQMLAHPFETVFSRIGVYFKAVPAVFWKRYVR
ncbi:MAG: radical SAM protein [Elusimicrobia bacterium]|nr:radical SAM protein [Elusimicrobiota bacterium]